MNIIQVSPNQLRNEEWFQWGEEFIITVNKYGAETLHINTLFPTFVAHHQQADQKLELIRKSNFTQEIEDADKRRDKIFGGFLAFVKAFRNQPLLTKNEAAERLYTLFKQYSKPIRNGTKAQESGAIYNLLQELEGKYLPDVTLLGLTEWTTALREAETKFLGYYDERVEENLDKPHSDLKAIRLAASRCYADIISIITAGLLIGGFGNIPTPGGDEGEDESSGSEDTPEGHSAPLPHTESAESSAVYNFAVEWNERLRYYHNILAQRQGRRKAASEKAKS